MKKIIILILVLCKGQLLLAQQEAMYTQYMFNMLAVNPAYAGSRGVLSATAMYRNQWVGVEGAPRTGSVSFDMATRNKKVGLGIQAFNDRIGIVKTTGFYASYAYRINFNEQGSSLAIGLQGGLSNYKADLTKVDLIDGGDPAFMQNINAIMPSFGAGVFYNTPKFYAGFSVPNLVKSYLRKDQYLYSTEVTAQKYLHLFLMAGYVFDLNESLKLKPSFLVKAVRGAPIEADVNVNFWIKEIVGIGASYRTGDAIAGLLELQLSNQFRLGYAYDHSISNLVKYNQGTHEIMLRFEFGWDKGQVISPRFF
ncbi:PorP/SprF family type IX secretion system membrane protein [Chitinophaga barathri]|uniref:Type IX secretion system membrane protein PorP/SprF n=1 Tax=Chitinophaga barathri TaxID=1647451 RepID=A0A3N4M8P6_9BACT|nr:type IX secretion system membrane protein PorP/SprF [Chitinophaga barathri]RPD37896.1 type IX secretion system membrane protein PorP/SprF [Chitinophaga barathri]